jgi:hypothetical protein
MAAEKATQMEEAKATAAEQRRREAEAAAAKAITDKQATEKALAEKTANDRATAELAGKQAAETQAANTEQKVAAVAPTSTLPTMSPQEMTKLVHSELRRVGCLTTSADRDWNASSERSLTLFNKYAGTKFDAKLASLDVFDAIRAKPNRVCPLACEHGSKPDGDACVKITCRAGHRLSDDNECEKIPDKKPVATRDDTRKRDGERRQIETAPSNKPQASGQLFCNSAGCRPVGKGCRVEAAPVSDQTSPMAGRTREVCN